MKKIITWIILIFMVANLTGCETLAKKFRRKKKATTKMPHMYQIKKYVKAPAPELYKKHFAYWASWHSDMIQELGENHKKDMLCIEQIIGNLKDMQNILVPDKGKELASHIDKLTKVRDIVVNEELSTANKTYVAATLEREERFIKKNFVYTKVKNYLKKNLDDEK